ncbi:hypothetical protein P3S68_021744 [Capsicum galapagoense]
MNLMMFFFHLLRHQFNFHLNATGEFDMPTLQHMVKPRCGNPYIVNDTTNMNSIKSSVDHTMAYFSFFEGQTRWPSNKTVLNYAFLPENQLTDFVKAVFGRAFDKWGEVTPLTFSETDSYKTADIRIGFSLGIIEIESHSMDLSRFWHTYFHHQ